MQLCYIDESGNANGADTSHFVLAGLSVPDEFWKFHRNQLETIKIRYELQNVEIHTAWMLKKYRVQDQISGFSSMSFTDRRVAVAQQITLVKNQSKQRKNKPQRLNRDFQRISNYTHLTLKERRQAIYDIAELISKWDVVRLFAECIDTDNFDPTRNPRSINEQAFEEIVSRFEYYLQTSQFHTPHHGLIIHDNNDSVAKSHSELMESFLSHGTLWTHISHIIETPMFVDSELTYMIQMADICAYAIRRYLENSEDELFDLVFQRAFRHGKNVMSVRHFTPHACTCKICRPH